MGAKNTDLIAGFNGERVGDEKRRDKGAGRAIPAGAMEQSFLSRIGNFQAYD